MPTRSQPDKRLSDVIIESRPGRVSKERMEKTGNPAKKVKPKVEGMMTGGMCRGMGAAIRGGDFKGVK
jgi:hypothetical protein